MNSLQKSNWSDFALICDRWVSWMSCRIRCLDNLPKRCPSLTSMTSLLESPQQCAGHLGKKVSSGRNLTLPWFSKNFTMLSTSYNPQQHWNDVDRDMILWTIYSPCFCFLIICSIEDQVRVFSNWKWQRQLWMGYISTLGTFRHNCTTSPWPLIKISQLLHKKPWAKAWSKLNKVLQEL